MSYDLDHGINRAEEEQHHRRRLSEQVRRMLQSAGLLEDPLPEGVRQEFIDSLDRVPKKEIKHDDDCPICATAFLDDPYPLVVMLPCPGRHQFDLECVSKWLKSSGTCPMCRFDFNEKRPKPVVAEAVDDEEEFDDMFA